MSTLLQTSEGDIDTTNGRFSVIVGPPEKAQKIENRLGLFEGEWFRDQRIGTLWWKRILGLKNPDLQIVRRVLRNAILSVPGITDLEEENLSFVDRKFAYDWVAIDDEGNQIPGGIGQPYIQAGV